MDNINDIIDMREQIDNSIRKMDKIIAQLETYCEHIELEYKCEIQKSYTSIPDVKIEPKYEIPESPEYYENEIKKFLTDVCQEKEKRIQLFNKILNLSMISNIILLAYILGIQYYYPS